MAFFSSNRFRSFAHSWIRKVNFVNRSSSPIWSDFSVFNSFNQIRVNFYLGFWTAFNHTLKSCSFSICSSKLIKILRQFFKVFPVILFGGPIKIFSTFRLEKAFLLQLLKPISKFSVIILSIFNFTRFWNSKLT